MSPRKMMSQAEYILPYAKAVIKQQETHRDGNVVLDIRYVADKFSATLSDALTMLHLLEDQGYCFTPLGDFTYRFVGMATERQMSADDQAKLMIDFMRDQYLSEIHQLTNKVNDPQLRHELDKLGIILTTQ